MLKQENTMDVFYLEDGSIHPFRNYSDELLNLEDLGRINSQGDLEVLSPPDIPEETLDIATQADSNNIEIMPMSPRGPPARTVFSGGLNFSVEINALDTHRKKYLYSHQLNRIYVDIKTDFPVQFRWDWASAAGPMFVRATTVFSDESQAEKRVERCIQHTHESANADMNMAIVKNVLHSSREPYTQGIYYTGEQSLSDSWYSVLVRFDGCTTEPYSHAYQFVCKNSCSTGINRRAIAIIFTLEDSFGKVYGRQMVGARVCACPRRDKHKDEEAAAPRPDKRRAAPPHTPTTTTTTKRVKVEDDGNVFALPQLSIVGLKTMTTGLEVMLSMMEQMAEAKKHDRQAVELYRSPITALRAELEKLKQQDQPES